MQAWTFEWKKIKICSHENLAGEISLNILIKMCRQCMHDIDFD